MIQLILYFLSLPAYKIQTIDTVTTKTTIRLWHEIHVCKKTSHDFTSLLSPEVNGYYIAAIKYNEIRAIANCKIVDEQTFLRSIAHAPAQPDAGIALLKRLKEIKVEPYWNTLKNQKIWYLEELFTLDDSCSLVKQVIEGDTQ